MRRRSCGIRLLRLSTLGASPGRNSTGCDKLVTGSHNLKCTFCGKAWHQVERIVTKGKNAICEACVRELSEMIEADAAQPG